MPILLDFETRSRVDLKKCGGRLYAAHASTEVLCCAWYRTENGEVGLWQPGEVEPFPGETLVAHNAMGFDRFIADRIGWARPAREWIDTSELARKCGLPGALETLGELYDIPKDKEASRFTRRLSSVRRPASISAAEWRTFAPSRKRALGRLPEITGAVMARVVPYCLSDVQIMAEAWEDLAPALEIDADVSRVEREVNDRGVCFDVDLARGLLRCDRENANAIVTEVAQELRTPPDEVRAVAMSNPKFCAMTGAVNARKATVADIDHPIARARRALASIASGKLIAGLTRVSPDGRLRDTHRYYGAHTGRWSGKGMQLQNLPRPHDRYEHWPNERIDQLAVEVARGRHHASAEEINLLLRATLCASPGYTLAVCDFAGVEARALAWCADDHKALAVFADSSRNPYKEMASVVFGRTITDKGAEYQVGKIAELACGYGMGAKKFGATAADAGSDLAALGVDANSVVRAWRRKHAPIVRFWSAVENAFKRAVLGSESKVDCFRFEAASDGSAVAVWLPSGRPIIYNSARISHRDGRPSIAYQGREGVEHTYGGKLTENLIQALCRDLLADALVRAELAGLRPVMHVHDEIVCEVPQTAGAEGYAELHQIMTTLPAWADGFPIGAAGFHGKRYRK